MTGTASNSRHAIQRALAVRIGENIHAMPIETIEEVLPALPIETIPQCPPFVLGVVFVRGHLIPVLSAAERLGLRNHTRPSEPHIVCVRIGSRLVGLEVDEAIDLIEIQSSSALPVEEMGTRRGFLTGLIEQDGQVIRLLDIGRMIGQEETIALEPLPRTAR